MARRPIQNQNQRLPSEYVGFNLPEDHITQDFFDIQSKLGFNSSNKTIKWLLRMSKTAIKEVKDGVEEIATDSSCVSSDDGDSADRAFTSREASCVEKLKTDNQASVSSSIKEKGKEY